MIRLLVLLTIGSVLFVSGCIQDANVMRNKLKGKYEVMCMREFSQKDFWETYDNNPEYAGRIDKMCGKPKRPQ